MPCRGEWRPVSPNRMPAGGERPQTPAAPPSLQSPRSPTAAPRAAAEPGDVAQALDVSGGGPSAASPAAVHKSPSPVPAAAQPQQTSSRSERPRPASAGRQTVANGETWGEAAPAARLRTLLLLFLRVLLSCSTLTAMCLIAWPGCGFHAPAAAQLGPCAGMPTFRRNLPVQA